MKNLKRLRQEKKLSIRRLAELSGVPKNHISEAEIGIRYMYPNEVEKIAKVLGVTVDELDGGTR